MQKFDPFEFRRVLGTFPTGVVVITAMDTDGQPLAMTVGSFVSVSLDPALVGFLPGKNSSSWAAIKASGAKTFGINILGNHQEDVCRAVASRKQNKLDGFDWSISSNGSPILMDAISFIDCEFDSVSDAGDHDWVMGKVLNLFTQNTNLPLLFYRGGYGSFKPGSMAVNTDINVDVLRSLDAVRPHMENLAAELVTEVSVMTLVDDELINVAAAGVPRRRRTSSKVGIHVPFMPPIGGVFAAFGGPEAEEKWFANSHAEADDDVREKFHQGLENVRERGYAYGIGHHVGEAIEASARNAFISQDPVERANLSMVVNSAASAFNIDEIERDKEYEFHSATAPVFNRDGVILFSMTVWGADGTMTGADVLATFEHLKQAADAATQQLKFANI